MIHPIFYIRHPTDHIHTKSGFITNRSFLFPSAESGSFLPFFSHFQRDRLLATTLQGTVLPLFFLPYTESGSFSPLFSHFPRDRLLATPINGSVLPLFFLPSAGSGSFLPFFSHFPRRGQMNYLYSFLMTSAGFWREMRRMRKMMVTKVSRATARKMASQKSAP